MAQDEEPKEQDSPQGEIVEDNETEQSDNDEILNPSASLLLHNYLQSANGHEIAKQVVELIKGIKQSTLDRNVEQDKVNAEQTRLRIELSHKHYGRLLTSQIVVFTLAIVSATFLTYIGKFESPVAILLGTLVGYFFGKKTSSKDS